MPSDASKWFREPETCEICTRTTEVKKIQNVSASSFYADYVLKVTPVVVTDGAKNWSATKVYSFDFFKNLYQNQQPDISDPTCQFFPYKTDFRSLHEALNMDPKRASLEDGQKPWYIGWSNCNDQTGRSLRKFYQTPYFLPDISENMALNWIFMGGPGHGAHMHVSFN